MTEEKRRRSERCENYDEGVANLFNVQDQETFDEDGSKLFCVWEW